jgi:hypothetical protein
VEFHFIIFKSVISRNHFKIIYETTSEMVRPLFSIGEVLARTTTDKTIKSIAPASFAQATWEAAETLAAATTALALHLAAARGNQQHNPCGC